MNTIQILRLLDNSLSGSLKEMLCFLGHLMVYSLDFANQIAVSLLNILVC